MELSPATQGNTALDINSKQDIIVTPGETPTIISTRIFGPLQQGTVGLQLGRLGLTSQGIQIHTRVINNDYEGKLKVMVSITLPWKVSKGDRIAQLLILPYVEKVGLKLTIQKTKIMASGPITSWQIDGKTLTDFIFLGSKITADGDCSHEI